MTNFDFLLKNKQFEAFAETAVTAEKLINIDHASALFNCRRALEFAIKWMYSVDSSLVAPYEDTLLNLMAGVEFKNIVGNDLYMRIDLIRRLGNTTAHKYKREQGDEARLCLENLFIFLDFVAYCYDDEYEDKVYNPNITAEEKSIPQDTPDINLNDLILENQALKEELTLRREEQAKTYVSKPVDLTEANTRKIYIDSLLRAANWTEGQDWLNEVKIDGMPNVSNEGYCDYVLYDDMQKPLAVIEAKRTSVSVEKGRQQASLYADNLEKKYGRRPVVFLTNGFETKIIDGLYKERYVAGIYSKRDLIKLFNLRNSRSSLSNICVNPNIAGRYYQIGAIKAVCETFEGRKRSALLVMATGSGKTRTIIALTEVLEQHGWIKNILFLADRTSLVTQAKRNFVNLLPNLSVSNLCESNPTYKARCVLSTYQIMINCIDNTKDEIGRLYTTGHFDLIICDEAHRSIYNKYKEIFNYFDAPIVGLTATPKDEIDKNTYSVFDLEQGIPTYGYELSQAVTDGFLVDYVSIETKLKFLEQGILYEELDEDEKEEFENTFTDEDGNVPTSISSSALNEWIYNEDTIIKVLDTLMTEGSKIEYGQKIGKTIIFAKNHRHAEKIFEVFEKQYQHLVGYAKVIDNTINYAQSAIDEFSDPSKLPQIAISVDMLDTGIDVPEVLNLVFFKKVMSKSKFWQMIGRGTRLCEGLIDGDDKNLFYIFDFCNNFEFFRLNKGKETGSQESLHSALFNLKVQIIYKLQSIEYQGQDFIDFRNRMFDEVKHKIEVLDTTSFVVAQHLRYVEQYKKLERTDPITFEDTVLLKEHIAPLVHPEEDEHTALRFDALMYGIELAHLVSKPFTRAKKDLISKVTSISRVANIPEVQRQAEFIQSILASDYIETCSINEFEKIRENLRDLMKYVNKTHMRYDTNFTDDLLSIEYNESELENDDLRNYKLKAEQYIKGHINDDVIIKLKTNKPLNSKDVSSLEQILWSEVGSKKEYINEFGEKPLGEFVREITGLDMKSAKEAFSDYLDSSKFDSRQIYFVNQIVEYIVHNGMMKDLSVLQEAPFTDKGSVTDVFMDISVWMGIKSIIDSINRNAAA